MSILTKKLTFGNLVFATLAILAKSLFWRKCFFGDLIKFGDPPFWQFSPKCHLDKIATPTFWSTRWRAKSSAWWFLSWRKRSYVKHRAAFYLATCLLLRVPAGATALYLLFSSPSWYSPKESSPNPSTFKSKNRDALFNQFGPKAILAKMPSHLFEQNGDPVKLQALKISPKRQFSTKSGCRFCPNWWFDVKFGSKIETKLAFWASILSPFRSIWAHALSETGSKGHGFASIRHHDPRGKHPIILYYIIIFGGDILTHK